VVLHMMAGSKEGAGTVTPYLERLLRGGMLRKGAAAPSGSPACPAGILQPPGRAALLRNVCPPDGALDLGDKEAMLRHVPHG
jgi:hypothetical protein